MGFWMYIYINRVFTKGKLETVCRALHISDPCKLMPSCIMPQVTKAFNGDVPHGRKNFGEELCITACPVNVDFHARSRQRYLPRIKQWPSLTTK